MIQFVISLVIRFTNDCHPERSEGPAFLSRAPDQV
jgi:hypothetical protein